MDVDARLEAVNAENERLRDELQLLKESLGAFFVAPLQFRLGPAETKILGRLLRGGAVTKEGFMALMYRDCGRDEAEIKIIDVWVCRLRAKLRPYGLQILTIRGTGYMMEPTMIDKFRTDWDEP